MPVLRVASGVCCDIPWLCCDTEDQFDICASRTMALRNPHNLPLVWGVHSNVASESVQLGLSTKDLRSPSLEK
ncbi:hypothetical protein PVK06_004492 [Gossypium arboreum]|uniref:Uncharacterized protein n=1 Tax=Gossypium arboreum TaxID=29729 RepID=A0ABR0QTF0_GOSAR|nr:hypothetical protein PVK06_004492 [Gossypium arboreum]